MAVEINNNPSSDGETIYLQKICYLAMVTSDRASEMINRPTISKIRAFKDAFTKLHTASRNTICTFTAKDYKPLIKEADEYIQKQIGKTMSDEEFQFMVQHGYDLYSKYNFALIDLDKITT